MITSHESISRDSLPSVRVLAWLSLLALIVIAALLVTVVLPAETGRDPTGAGQRLGLTEMGRIKVALAKGVASNGAVSNGAAVAQTARSKRVAIGGPGAPWRDSMAITLQPSEGIEVKMTMRALEKARYAWTTSGGDVYFNMHGEPLDAPKDYAAHRYGKGTSAADSGELVAAFDGVHGWFWRNRTDQPITITLKTGGEYLVLKELK